MLIDPPASKSTEVRSDRQSLRTVYSTEMAEDQRSSTEPSLNRSSISTPPLSLLRSMVPPLPAPVPLQDHLAASNNMRELDGHHQMYCLSHGVPSWEGSLLP